MAEGLKSGLSVNGGREFCIGGSFSKISYITIDGFECRLASNYGIVFHDVSLDSAGITVQNSYIHDTGDGDYGYHNQLMFAEYMYGHAYGTKFLNNKVGGCYGHNCIQIHGDTGNPLIQGNECYNWRHSCIDVKYSAGALVDQNVVHDGLGDDIDEAAFYIENASGGPTSDITWTHNVAYGTILGVAFQCQNAGAPVTCYMYNNTVYSSTLRQGTYGGGSVSFTVVNNILDTPTPRTGGGYVTWDYNDNVQASPIGVHDLSSVNPQYVTPGTDFHLTANSPVIDRGVDVGLPYNGSAPDMGAHEYGP